MVMNILYHYSIKINNTLYSSFQIAISAFQNSPFTRKTESQIDLGVGLDWYSIQL